MRPSTATSATSSRSGSLQFPSPLSEPTWGGESQGHATASAGSPVSLSGTDSENEAGRKRYRSSYSEGTLRKKLKRDALSRPARHFGRTVEMWRQFLPIMNEGQRDPAEADLDNPQVRTIQHQYERLLEICPRLTEEIRVHSIEEVASVMENARASGHGEDIKHVKDLMQSLRSFHPALKANDKESRGFNHPQIGRLLVSSAG
ncbi:hypothetical protein JB92DRAFT_2824537 [Gautieria morchelliformis]|nr:hypothetical protein JB92DRAFT_2824537 [Gautieria morchelliformis]